MKCKILLSFTMIILLFSCDTTEKDRDASEHRDDVEKADKINEDRFDDRDRENAAEYVVDLAESNLTEIKLAEYAVTNAGMLEVKDLATLLKKDHEKMLTDIRELATKRNISLPAEVGEEGNRKHQRLVDKKDLQFDETYLEIMEDSHESSLNRLENGESKFKDDADLQKVIQGALPVVRNHLEEIKNLRNLVNEKSKEQNKEKRKSL